MATGTWEVSDRCSSCGGMTGRCDIDGKGSGEATGCSLRVQSVLLCSLNNSRICSSCTFMDSRICTCFESSRPFASTTSYWWPAGLSRETKLSGHRNSWYCSSACSRLARTTCPNHAPAKLRVTGTIAARQSTPDVLFVACRSTVDEEGGSSA
jgi:hypothetical protein